MYVYYISTRCLLRSHARKLWVSNKLIMPTQSSNPAARVPIYSSITQFQRRRRRRRGGCFRSCRHSLCVEAVVSRALEQTVIQITISSFRSPRSGVAGVVHYLYRTKRAHTQTHVHSSAATRCSQLHALVLFLCIWSVQTLGGGLGRSLCA